MDKQDIAAIPLPILREWWANPPANRPEAERRIDFWWTLNHYVPSKYRQACIANLQGNIPRNRTSLYFITGNLLREAAKLARLAGLDVSRRNTMYSDLEKLGVK